MQLTRLLRVDSYASARNELSRLFNSFSCANYKDHASSLHTQRVINAKLEKSIRRYLLYTSSRLKHLPSLAPLQSWIRGNVNLLLREARVRHNGPIALAALQVIMSEERYIPNVELVWLKDVLAACTSTAEVEQFKKLIMEYSCISNTEDEDGSEVHVANKVKRSRIQGDAAAMLLGGIEVKHNSKKLLMERSREEHSTQINDDNANNNSTDLVGMDAESKYLALLASKEKAIQSHKEEQEEQEEEREEEMQKVHVAHAFASFAPQPYAKSIYKPAERALMGISYLQHHYCTGNRNLAAISKDSSSSSSSSSVVTSPNQSFIRYFQKQGIVRSETEVMSLFHAMQQRKAFQSFRIVPSQMSCPGLTPMLHTILCNRHGIHRVDWLPAEYEVYALNCADEMNYDTLLRNRQLLTSLSSDRVISFHSISSIMPVLFLQPELHDRILDLCAAPGGKTALILDCLTFQREKQLYERKHHYNNTYNPMTSSVYCGCVIANEADKTRAKELASRLSRYKSSNPSLTITSVPGENFALSALLNNIITNGTTNDNNYLGLHVASANMMRFDKILVDAPCSGEGTLGKDHQQWRLWHPRQSFQFVVSQLNLLSTAIRCCEAGGVIVYSTCTLNPIENEAVVAEILRMYGDYVELVQPSFPASTISSLKSKTSNHATIINTTNNNNSTADCFLPPIVLRHGLRSWFVPSREGGFYQTTQDAFAHNESILDFCIHEQITNRNNNYNNKKRRNGFSIANAYNSSNNEECLLTMMFAPHCADEFRNANSSSSKVDGNANSGNETSDKSTLYNKETYISEQLHRCCRRILPHDNNGAEGFFIAVLQIKRVVPLTAITERQYLSPNQTHQVKLLTETTSASASASSPLPHNNYKTENRSNVFTNHSHNGDSKKKKNAISVSLPSVSLLHTRGLVKLSATHNHLIYTLLFPFFMEVSKTNTKQMSSNANHIENNNLALPCWKESKKQVHTRISHFLSSQELGVLWHRTEGMRFVGNDTLNWLDQNNNWIVASALPSSSSSSSERTNALLETGVIVFTAQGKLTWQGAQLLWPYVTSHLFRLPLAYVQLLLAHRSLTLSDKIIADNSTGKTIRASTLYVHRHRHESATLHLPMWWKDLASELCVTETLYQNERKKKKSREYISDDDDDDDTVNVKTTNNAIVEIDTSDAFSSNVDNGINTKNNSSKIYHDQLHRNNNSETNKKHNKRQKLNENALSSWCLPVKIECHNTERLHVTFHLLLDDSARHVCQALLNRFLSSSRHGLSNLSVHTGSAQNYLQRSQEYNVSNIMSPSSLYGANPNPHEVNRQLFTNPRVAERECNNVNKFDSIALHFDQINSKHFDDSAVQSENEQTESSNIVEI